MDNSLLVGVAQADAYLANNFQLFDKRKLASGTEQILQRISGDKLHDDVWKAILVAEVVHCDDIRMIQDAGASLQQKALTKFFSRFGQRLNRHFATDRFIHSSVNDTHAAYTQDAQDLVFADLSNRCTGIHG